MTNDQPTFLERTEAQRQYLYNVLTVSAPLAIGYGIVDGNQALLWLALGGALLGTGTAAVVLKVQRKSRDDTPPTQ